MQLQYGSTDPFAQERQPSHVIASAFAKPPSISKKYHDVFGGLVSLLFPWLAFTVNMALLSFSMHYKHAALCWFLVQLHLCIIILCGFAAYHKFRRGRVGASTRDPTWHVFACLMWALGWLLGALLGVANYSGNMCGFYDLASLETYLNVDPAKASGQQFLDAGRMVFARTARLDISRSFGFKSSTIYCVAPIVSSDERLASYDFWAVGTGCCSGNAADYRCSEGLRPSVHAGTRLLDDGQAAYFRLAIQQAESAHHIRAGHPLLFHWTEDPIGEANARQDRGLKNFLLATLTFFGLQLFLVLLVALGKYRFLVGRLAK